MTTWSSIRHKLETDYLAQALRGHIQYFATSYSRCPDHEGRASIRLDGQEILSGGYYNQWVKAALYPLDEKYEQLMQDMAPGMGAVEKLIYLNHELLAMIETGVSMDLLARLLSTQLLARGEKHLLDRNRTYFKLLRQIITDGQRSGELRTDCTVNDIVKAYALWERALLYDWCLCRGDYSLVAYTDRVTPMFLESYRGKTENSISLNS